MTRKPAFWIILALLGLTGSILAIRLFPVAFPILSVEIEMDRQGALDQARALAARFEWEPEEFRQAASFGNVNSAFQTYMELEGGGLDEVASLSEEGVFNLYAWRVRHFAEGTVEEAEIRFSPSGVPIGFDLKLSEDTPGENLTPEGARETALQRASSDWGVDTDRHVLLESSQEEHPGGRIDHVFVFERDDVELGEARIRLRIRVAGSRLAEVHPFVHVPDAFLRRYQDTRNANESISLAGTIIFLLLFIVLGGGLGTVHLLKNRRMEWKAPLIWGGVVSGLMALAQVNSLPLTWMAYNTAMPSQLHVASLVLMAGLAFLAGTFFLALLFMVGEGLMRVGFPDQIQQWKVWSPGVSNSTPVLGRTMAPYLILGLKLALVVVFYLATSRFLGWWSPASSLAEPDLLATYFPWLTAVSTSLFAALSEETIFRAIPIGAAAIMGRRYGKPGLWIWGAVVLQALVFGASHANYPQQPAYARVVEIFPSYFVWGVVCVYFGLIPSIIAHYTYDLVLFALPLFAAETSGIWIDRVIVIGAGLLPLIIVSVSRIRRGSVEEAPGWALNRNWIPRTKEEPEEASPQTAGDSGLPPVEGKLPAEEEVPAEFPDRPSGVPAVASREISSRGKGVVGILALAGLILWVSDLQPGGTLRLNRTRAEAEADARAALAERGVDLGPGWTPFLSVDAQRGLSHQFVWREGGEGDYQEVVGRFLDEPAWAVRYVNFEVAPEERAESYYVRLPGTGEAPEVSHFLPEGRPGGNLGESEARILALGTVDERWGVRADAVREISAEETSHPARTDWTFTFAATEGYPLAAGEARLEVRISGEEVTDISRFIHVPETWEREWATEASKRQIVTLILASLLGFLALGGLVLAIRHWIRGTLQTPPLRLLTVIMAGLLLVTGANEWPNTVNVFTTQLSYSNQVVMVLLGIGMAAVFLAAGVGLLGGLGHTWIHERPRSVKGPMEIGLGLGAVYVGISGPMSRLTHSGLPAWPDFGGAVSYLPWVSISLGTLVSFLTMTVGALLLLAALERSQGTRWAWGSVPLILLVGLTLTPNPPGSGPLLWILAAAAMSLGIGILWSLCRRLGWAILPGVMAAPVLLNLIDSGLQHPYPGHTLGTILGVCVVLIATVLWTRALGKVSGSGAPASGTPSPHRPNAGYTPEPLSADQP